MYTMIALLLAAGAIFSATFTNSETTIGVVSAVDLNAKVLVLADGKTFLLPDEYVGPSPAAGEEVVVYFQVNEENDNMADAVVPVG